MEPKRTDRPRRALDPPASARLSLSSLSLATLVCTISTVIARYEPYVVVPPLSTCEPAYILYGQGTPPYRLFPSQSCNMISL